MKSLWLSLGGKGEVDFSPKGMSVDFLREKIISAGISDERSPRPLQPFPEFKPIEHFPEAISYMKSRDIPEETWNEMGLGYWPEHFMPTWKGQIPSWISKERAFAKIPGKRVLFPIRHEGMTVGYSGRNVKNQAPKIYRPVENIGGIFLDPWNILENHREKEFPWVLLVEGEFDAAACVREKLPVLACFQAHLGEKRARKLLDFREIIVFFDPDESGDKGAKEAHDILKPMFTGKIRRFRMREGGDPGSMPVGFGNMVRKFVG
jgi:DNA primase